MLNAKLINFLQVVIILNRMG